MNIHKAKLQRVVRFKIIVDDDIVDHDILIKSWGIMGLEVLQKTGSYCI